ncbi:MAG TPA: M20 family metallo-hydrolase [Exilispira sp.]|nr:M20 family metallo-hydrolase [Exilispira sp.]
MDEKNLLESIKKTAKELETELIELSKKFISFNSVNPKTGGPGELEVSKWLKNVCSEMNVDEIKEINAPDNQVPYGFRPNILALIDGEKKDKRIWFMTHMDKVPAGEITLWENDPFTPVVKNGKIYGRGSEDNGASLVASIIAAKILKKLNIKPKYDLGLMFVSDEETGSEFGISYVLNNFQFGEDDWFIVPDAGNPEGNEIEIAEKSIMWVKMITKGKQAHASMPHLARNAHRAAMECAIAIDSYIHTKYNDIDDLFVPNISTFEPTKKELNVENVNTIPALDIICFDGRILPHYDIDAIFNEMKQIAKIYESKYQVEISFEFLQKNIAPKPTSSDHPLVISFSKAIEKTRNFKPKLVGIGGGTCAAILRKAGLPAIVWATIEETAHQPNENCTIEYILNDAITYAYFLATVE